MANVLCLCSNSAHLAFTLLDEIIDVLFES
jgi:hypothetical protein